MSNINIKRNRQTPSDQSILNKKNFDSVLESYKASMSPKKWYQSMKVWSGVVATACIAGVIGVYLASSENEETSSPKELSKQELNEKFNSDLQLSYLDNQEEFVFDPSRDTILITENGSILSVPGNSFASTSNELRIVINEIDDPVKMFQSKIDMAYDSAGTKYHFESAGMIEIRAYDAGKSIDLNEGKEISVALVTSSLDPTYNLYVKTDDNWDYITTANDIFDPLSIEENNFTLAEDTECNDHTNLNSSSTKIGKVDPKFATFNISTESHPELKEYENILFQVAPSEKDFEQDYYLVSWEKIELKKDGKNYNILVERGGMSLTFKVNPVLNSSNYAAYIKSKTTKNSKYTELESRKDVWEQNFEKQKLSFTYSNKSKSYNVANILSKDINYAVSKKPRRVFNVQNLGTLNCDHVLPDEFNERVRLANLNFDMMEINLAQTLFMW